MTAWQRVAVGGWLLIVTASVTAHPFDPFAEEKKTEFQLVVEYLRQGETHEALLQADNAIAKFPKHGPFYTLRAQILLKRGQPQEALSDVEKAITLAPDYALSYWVRGLIHQHQNHPADAIENFNQVLKWEDQNQLLLAQAIGSRGMSLTDLGRHREALEDLNRALEIRADAFAERQFRAVAYLALGRLNEAESDIATLLARDPNNGLLHRLQGELWLQRQDTQRALTALERALELNPQDAHAYRLRAHTHKVLGHLEKYHADLAKACRLGDATACQR
jgi:tetratricopeptide (TPR) repeat protein